MARRYRMTPRRKQALRRAQLASARKRRGQRNKRIAGGLGVLAAAGGAVFIGSRMRNRKMDFSVQPALERHYTRINLDRRKPKPNPVPKQSGPKAIFKVNKQGVAKRTTKGRMIYDSGRRRQYWQVEAKTRKRRKRG